MLRLVKSAVRYARQWRDDLNWAADLPTLLALRRRGKGVRLLHVRVGNHIIPVHVRAATYDTQRARMILCDESEYRLPERIGHRSPEVIFDIGANIGMTTLYFAAMFPKARIVCFEPLPENLALLEQNVAPLGDRVTIIPKGLGKCEGSFTYQMSDDPANFGGGTFHGVSCDRSRTIELPVTTISRVCDQLEIHQVDLIKIDTEGAEWSILDSTPTWLLERCHTIIGELHGVNDLDVLQLLERTHRLGYSKRIDRHAFPFVAVQRQQRRALSVAA